ncbi:MAG: hypothetical protein K8S99_04370 [Planctomycetes bacterium]|nr:hypothetical protein [Planctomycetota bacterium]
MKPTLVALRFLETIFLVGVVVTYTVSPTSQAWGYSFLSVFCNFSIASSADHIVISSVVIGYVFSLVGTGMQWRTANPKLRGWSLSLALLGLIVCLNEVGRYFLGYHFQILVHVPIAVVVIDWIMIRQYKTVSQSPEVAS